jgi:hypothetical protein
MKTQTTDRSYIELDRPKKGEETINLPSSDRGRPQDDAEGSELPGEIQETPTPTVVPPGGDPIQVLETEY